MELSSVSVDCPEDLGVDMVNILYKNTNLSYNVCSQNVIEIFEHLSKKLPQFQCLTDNLVKSIKTSLEYIYNPDALNLVENLKFLSDLKTNLENGNTNFYEVQSEIENYLEKLNKISVKSCSSIYKDALETNREYILNIVDIWKLCTNKRDKLVILKLFYDYFTADGYLIDVLFNNTNLIEEVAFMLDEGLKTNDTECVEVASIFLIYIFTNVQQLSLNLKELLNKEDGFLQTILNSIENEIFYTKEINCLDRKLSEHSQVETIDNLLICILLSLNNHFLMPNENPLLNYFQQQAHLGNLSNKLIQYFNFEDEPLKQFKLEKTVLNESFAMNSVIKLLSDLLSNEVNTSNIFYLSDYNLVIDIIIRQLSNLSSDDQIRMEYLSLIELILSNSNYFEHEYRIDELKQCFKSIINEKIETMDQDIVRVLYASFPNLKI